MRLAILIPTLPETYSINLLNRLNTILDPQIAKWHGQVTKHIHDAGRSMPTGTKRNELIRNTDSDYFVFVDSDDLVPSYYVDDLMRAISEGPDVVTFIGDMTTNGVNKRKFTIKLGEKYEERNGEYFRYPNHISCVRREAVKGITFQPIWEREDFLWATEVMQRKVLKTEIHITRPMYLYDYITNKPKR